MIGSSYVNQGVHIVCIHSWIVVSSCISSNQLRIDSWSDNQGKHCQHEADMVKLAKKLTCAST
jgi:hypothetical protein